MARALNPNDPTSVIAALGPKLDTRQPHYLKLESYYDGNQPLGFIAQELREELGHALQQLCINWPSLVVSTVAERMVPKGVSIPKQKAMTDQANAIWQRCDMDEQMPQGITDSLLYGRSYGIVWGDEDGRATINIESPLQMIAHRNPSTRRWDCALKRWVEEDGRAYAIVYTDTEMTWLRSKSKNADVSDLYGSVDQVTDLSHLSPTGWETIDVVPNPLGELNVVVIPNKPRILRPEGFSELEDVLSMADGINKLATDMMVTSEFYSKGRRWATAVDIEEDEDGELREDLDVHKQHGSWHLFESEAAKVGQFSEAELANFVRAVEMLSQYLSAVKKIPAHYMDPAKSGLASAEAVRAAEAPLVVTAKSKWVPTGGSIETIMRLALMVESGDLPTADELGMETLWGDAENLTDAQRVDAASKKAALKVPTEQLWIDAGYTPQQIADMKTMRDDETSGPLAEMI